MIASRLRINSRPADTTVAERKREVTRGALAEAALNLAIEHGLEYLTVPSIAAAAGVSPRTFNNYFSSKEEAIVAPAFDRAARILETFEQGPASETIWSAISSAILAQLPDDIETDSALIRSAQLARANSALRGEQLKACAAIEELLAAAIARRMNATPPNDMAPRVIAGSAITAARIAFDYWVDANGQLPLRAVVADALGLGGSDFGAVGMQAAR